MRIRIIGDNLQILPSHERLVDKLLKVKLEKFLQPFNPDMKEALLRIEKRTRWGYKVNLSMVLPGKKQVFAEEVNDNLRQALTKLRAKISRQVKAYRDKIGVDNKRNVALKAYS